MNIYKNETITHLWMQPQLSRDNLCILSVNPQFFISGLHRNFGNLHRNFGNLPNGVIYQGFPSGSDGKASVCSAGSLGSIPGLGRSPGEGNGSPLQYSCLENPMDRGVWQVAKSLTLLSEFTFTFLWQSLWLRMGAAQHPSRYNL